jgi:TatD DNase family protein
MLQDNARTSSDIDTTIAALSYQIANNRERVVAVWECGFDLYWTAWMHDQDLLRLTTLQEDLFVKQCLLARFYDLPVVIHSRNAWHQTRHVVKQFPDVIFYFHCWWYEPEQVSVLVEHMPKSFLWFCGNITYPKAWGIQQSLLHLWNLYKQSPHRVPRFVIETDAPYLSPQQVRWSVNSPKHCQYTYAHIADMLNISVYEVQAYTYQSMSELFSR